jgi:AP-3 complex subunit beta
VQNAKKIFLATKPAPLILNRYTGRENFQLGSMSHYLNTKVNRYQELPDFPQTAPDSTVRNVGEEKMEEKQSQKKVQEKSTNNKKGGKSFYSDESSEDSSSESSSESSEKASEDSESDSSGSSSSSEDSDDSEVVENHAPLRTHKEAPAAPQKSNLDLLLDLDDAASSAPGQVMTPSLGGFLTPMSPGAPHNKIELVSPTFITFSPVELLNKVNGYGLGITYKFTRSPHLFSASMVSIELQFTNHSNVELTDIQIASKNLTNSMSLHEFAALPQLAPKQTLMGVMGIDFNDSSQAANFEIRSSGGSSKVSIKPCVGELVRSVVMPAGMFKDERNKLRGMTESSCKVPVKIDQRQLQTKIFEVANVAAIQSTEPDTMMFAGQTLNSKSLVLVTVVLQEDSVALIVNCEKLVVSSILMNEIKDSIKK